MTGCCKISFIKTSKLGWTSGILSELSILKGSGTNPIVLVNKNCLLNPLNLFEKSSICVNFPNDQPENLSE